MVRRTMVTLILLVVSGLGPRAQAPQSTEQSKSLNLAAYAELLRSDVRTQKVAILTEVLDLTEAEDKAFWPIYREYQISRWPGSATSASPWSRNTCATTPR